jgi:hypothetical protein
VGGYGTDQAFLRFETNAADHAPTVLLGVMSENIERNINQFRALVYSAGNVSLKPRFILGANGKLELVPLPQYTAEEYRRMVQAPERYLSHEELLPDTRLGPTRERWPYAWTVLATLANHRLHSYLWGQARWNELYDPAHSSRALAITTGILEAFVDEARRQGRAPAVIVFPTYLDLTARQRGEPWIYQALLDELKARDIPMLNAGDEFIEVLAGQPPDFFASSMFHYGEAGNALVAGFVERFLEERKLVRAPRGG